MSDTHIPEQLKVSRYFKKTSPAEWSISGYIEYEKEQTPFSFYPTFQQHFKLDLTTIKSSDAPNDAKTAAGRLRLNANIRYSQKPSTSSTPIKYNTNITANSIGNVYCTPTTMSSAMNASKTDSATEPAMNAGEPASASASESAPAPKPALKRKGMAVESSSFIKALFSIVYELMSFIADQLNLNTVEYVDWIAGHTEEEYVSYQVPILRIMIRGTSVSLKTGESTSAASKFERQVNENEYGGVSKHIMRRRIDLLLKGHLSDDKDKQQIIKMAAMEIKPAVCAWRLM
ncbi:hypothetical protein [Parasitella parasitica]|uniref:Uncharacterized protein n=1 Tax=Parasitella parasitica TaxID=35722 RepID=A0A0B7NNR2_9FUNG|nr:hypothetical protein [Parasitella parasitica]